MGLQVLPQTGSRCAREAPVATVTWTPGSSRAALHLHSAGLVPNTEILSSGPSTEPKVVAGPHSVRKQ